MLHALGGTYETPKCVQGRYYYHPYRNHYDAGGEDVLLWDDLVKKGYAVKGVSQYMVTPLGLDVLELLTGVKIYSDDYNGADAKRSVLRYLMEQTVSCGGFLLPQTIGGVARALHLSQNVARDAMRLLSESGWIERRNGAGYSAGGWSLTSFAMCSEEYGKAVSRYEACPQVVAGI